MTTPDRPRAIARAADGTEADITEGVRALYDLAVSSMDFRSGFWTAEDARPVALLARQLGFPERQEIERYLREQEHWDETVRWQRSHDLPGMRQARRFGVAPPHDHVFSASGFCMWPCCKTADPEWEP